MCANYSYCGSKKKSTINVTTLNMISGSTCEFSCEHLDTEEMCNSTNSDFETKFMSKKQNFFFFLLPQCYQMRPGLIWSWRSQEKLQKLAHESKSYSLKIQSLWAAQKLYLAVSSKSEDTTTGMLVYWTHYFKMELNYSFNF